MGKDYSYNKLKFAVHFNTGLVLKLRLLNNLN